MAEPATTDAPVTTGADTTDTTPKGGPEDDKPTDKTFTQAELDQIVQDRIKRERQKYEGFDDLKAKAEKFDQLEAEKQSDLERLEARATEAEGKLTPLQQQNARLSVAIQKGLVGDRAFLVDRLKGETEEELAADAESLLEQFGNGTPSPPDFGGGARKPAAEAKTPEAAHNELILGLTGHLEPSE